MRKQPPFRTERKTAGSKFSKTGGMILGIWLGCNLVSPGSWALEAGVTEQSIRIGANTALEGDRKHNALSLKKGIDTALASQTVRGLRVEYMAINDFYDPKLSVAAISQLLDKGVFAILGSYGSPTVKATLPLLAEKKVPVIAPFSGAAFTGPGEVLNFRASYASEVESVVSAALAGGVKPNEVCAYVQNDAFGVSGLTGLRSAMAKHGAQDLVAKLDQIIALPGVNPARNGLGPVGVYEKDIISGTSAYNSLKKWETDNGVRCRLVAMAAVYEPAVNFIAYGRAYKNEPWIYSVTSNVTSDRLQILLKEKKVTDKVIATEVVPHLNSSLAVVAEARKALGSDFNPVSLEGYLDGKLFLTILQAVEGPLTRENFLKAARRQLHDLGGIKVDFTTSNQGYNYVGSFLLRDGQFAPITTQELTQLFK